MLRPELINKKNELQLENEGFIKLESFLDEDVINTILALYNKYNLNAGSKAIWFSNVHEEFINATKLSIELERIVKPLLSNYLKEFKVYFFTLASKMPNALYLEPHRDYAITDEMIFQYRNVWIPLVDTNEENGGLFVVPKSNKLLNKINIIGDPLCDEELVLSGKLNNRLPLLAKKGDLVIYQEKTFHGSFPNLTKTDRPVIHFGILHTDSFLLYYDKIAENKYNRYKISSVDLLSGQFSKCINEENYYDTYLKN